MEESIELSFAQSKPQSNHKAHGVGPVAVHRTGGSTMVVPCMKLSFAPIHYRARR